MCVCVCVRVQQLQQTFLQPRLVQKKLQQAVKPMNIIVLLACRSVFPSFLLLSNFYSSLKTLKSRFFFFFQDPDSRFWQQFTNHQKTSSCTITSQKCPSTNSISFNFFNQLHFIQFLQPTECHRISQKHNFTLSSTNSKHAFLQYVFSIYKCANS